MKKSIAAYLLMFLGIIFMGGACSMYYLLWSIAARHGGTMDQLGIFVLGSPVTATGFLIAHAIVFIIGAVLAFFGWRKRKSHA